MQKEASEMLKWHIGESSYSHRGWPGENVHKRRLDEPEVGHGTSIALKDGGWLNQNNISL